MQISDERITHKVTEWIYEHAEHLRYSLLLITFVTIFALTGCAREEVTFISCDHYYLNKEENYYDISNGTKSLHISNDKGQELIEKFSRIKKEEYKEYSSNNYTDVNGDGYLEKTNKDDICLIYVSYKNFHGVHTLYYKISKEDYNLLKSDFETIMNNEK